MWLGHPIDQLIQPVAQWLRCFQCCSSGPAQRKRAARSLPKQRRKLITGGQSFYSCVTIPFHAEQRTAVQVIAIRQTETYLKMCRTRSAFSTLQVYQLIDPGF